MPRSKKVYHTEFPYHITARTNNGAPFPCTLSEAWNIYVNALWFYSRIYETRILAFVLMNNHYHLLMTTPKGNLPEFMQPFMKSSSDEIREINNVENHLYGGSYYSSLIGQQNYFQNVLKYIYQNPVRAKGCDSVLDYEFSTLPSFLGQKKLEIPIFDDFNFFESLDSNLKWLDQKPNEADIMFIKKGLALQEFKAMRDPSGFRDDTLLKSAPDWNEG
jgi:putative transposase